MAKPVTISVDDDAGTLRAVEREPKCSRKHQVRLGDLYETGLAIIMLFTQGAIRNYLSIRSWVTPSPACGPKPVLFTAPRFPSAGAGLARPGWTKRRLRSTLCRRGDRGQ
jgi:hypothetical protein